VRRLAFAVVAFLLLGQGPPDPNEPFDRGRFGGFIDEDGDCQDTRAEVLIRQSEIPVTFRGQDECVVQRGRWTDPYSGQVVTAAAAMEIDVVVPLEHSHESGNWRLGNREKGEYLNDLTPGHLWAVHVSTFTAKNERPIKQYKPRTEFYCDYAASWFFAKMRWDLGSDPNEIEELRLMAVLNDPNGVEPCVSDLTPD